MSMSICEALYPYHGTEGQPSPLLFEAGEEILVIRKDFNGWWEGEKGGQRGFFPAAYVKEKEVISTIPSTPETEEEEPPPDIEPLPPGWREAKAPDGRTYYFFKKTKETTWKRPTARNMARTGPVLRTTIGEQASRPVKKHTRGPSDSSSLGNSPPSSPGPYVEEEEEKPVYYVVNGVCLPDAKRAKEQELLQPGRYSYCDYFWLRTEIEKPLADCKDEGKKELKKLETNLNDLRKQMTQKYQSVERDKISLNERQKELETKMQSPKKEDELAKAKRKSTKHREDLIGSVAAYNDAKDEWFEEMVTQSLVLENREIQRIELVKKQIRKYTKLVNNVSAKTDKACSSVMAKTDAVDPSKDRELWVKKHKTGSVRPVDIASPL